MPHPGASASAACFFNQEHPPRLPGLPALLALPLHPPNPPRLGEEGVVVQALLQIEQRLQILPRVGPLAGGGPVRVRQVRPELAHSFHAARIQRAAWDGRRGSTI